MHMIDRADFPLWLASQRETGGSQTVPEPTAQVIAHWHVQNKTCLQLIRHLSVDDLPETSQ